MNSIQKVSTLPMRRCMGGYARRRSLPAPAPVVETTPCRSLGCAHIAPSRNLDLLFEKPSAFETEQIVQLSIPVELASLGVDKIFAEKRGSEIIAFAATKKLLAEEKLRMGLKNFSVPIEGIVRETYRPKISAFSPVISVLTQKT